MKKKYLGVGLALGSLALLLVGCGQKQSADNSNRTFKTTAQSNVLTVDPNRVTDVGSDLATTQVLEGLYKQNNQGKIVPSLATKIVKPTNHGKTYTFNLRKDGKWNDGSPVTAQDFVISARRQVNPKTKSQRAAHYQTLKTLKPSIPVNFPQVSLASKHWGNTSCKSPSVTLCLTIIRFWLPKFIR